MKILLFDPLESPCFTVDANLGLFGGSGFSVFDSGVSLMEMSVCCPASHTVDWFGSVLCEVQEGCSGVCGFTVQFQDEGWGMVWEAGSGRA